VKKAMQIGTNDAQTNDIFKSVCMDRGVKHAYLIEPLEKHNPQIEKVYSDMSHEIHNIAITPNPYIQKADLYMLGDITRHFSLVKRKTHPCRDSGPMDKISVPCKTFAKFCEENNIEKLDTLYIDAEGLDYEIIMSIDLAHISIDNIIFEEWDHDDDDENYNYRTGSELLEVVYKKLRENGYSTCRYQERDIKAWK